MIVDINWNTQNMVYCPDHSPVSHIQVNGIFIVFAFQMKASKRLKGFIELHWNISDLKTAEE